jgi:signal transduction histidine kinase
VSPEVFRQVADLLPEPVLLVEGGGTVLAANRGAARRLAVSPEALAGKGLAELVTDPEGAVAEYLRLCSRTREPVAGALALIGPGGEPIPCDCRGAVARPRVAEAPAVIFLRMLPRAGPPSRFALLNQQVQALTREIHRRIRVEAELREADRRKDQFLALLGHELRNPLGALRNTFALFERRSAGNPELERLRERMERQITRISRLLDDLQDTSRVRLGKLALRREPVDMATLARQAAEDCRSALESADLSLILDLPRGPVLLEGDPTRLAQVLTNLLNNAIKFTDPGGQVALRLISEPAWVVLQVRDTGIGLEPNTLPRIFESFSQVETSLARTRGGLGLGLALVKALVELHGGDIHVASDGLGRGSEFTIRLPRALGK